MKTAIKICLWVLTFVPLIVDYKVFFPTISGKVIFIESFLVLAGILLLINFFYSRHFRGEIVGKIVKHIKHPLVLSVLAYIFIFIISTIFAVDKYSAFWGDLSRAEGLAGTMFFFSFFVFSLLIFEKKDWLWFFKLSLFTSLILLGKEFAEYFNGIARPGSYTGNPTFLAGYLLFSITSGLIVLGEVKNKLWKSLSLITIILAIVGIFMAQTRGTILGLGFGIIVALIYCTFKGKDLNYNFLNLRKVSLMLLCLGFIFAGVFVITRKNEVWQRIPGLSRVAIIGTGDTEDLSTNIRLIVYKFSLQSINPIENSWKKFSIGWGPDNYILAYSRYFNPELYEYQREWSDRPHNKLIEVFVMNGVFGLLTYLAIWFFLFKSIIKRKEFSLVSVGLLVLCSSYLIHLMFVFDQISTSIPYFVLLAFATHLTAINGVIVYKTEEKNEISAGVFLLILMLLLSFIYFRSTLPGYIQMRNYSRQITSAKSVNFESNIDSVFSPFTLAQMNIRRDFLEITNNLYNKNPTELNLRLLKRAILKAEEYLTVRPENFQFMTTLADLYSRKGNSLKDQAYLKKGEELLHQVLFFAPNRPDINIRLALNLLYQERFMESFNLYETIFLASPVVVQLDKVNFEGIYVSLIKYFYEQKDKENFTRVVDRLKANSYEDSALLDKILDYLNKTGTWPRVDFK